MGAKTNITQYANVDIFGSGIGKIQFFLLSELRTFDEIIGHDTIKSLKAIINAPESYFTLLQNFKNKTKQLSMEQITNIELRLSHSNHKANQTIKEIVIECPGFLTFVT